MQRLISEKTTLDKKRIIVKPYFIGCRSGEDRGAMSPSHLVGFPPVEIKVPLPFPDILYCTSQIQLDVDVIMLFLDPI